eukprot:NODE_659_length_4968_cov_0.490655.p1 type:complete len:774 gc:universal NODE_659_length_4968_cov_0.490655:2432-111(-)
MKLFVYGTLLYDDVQISVTGRKLRGKSALLKNYNRYQVKRQSYPGIVYELGGVVEGQIIEVTEEELLLIDDYEGIDYERQIVKVMSEYDMHFVESYVFTKKSELEGYWHWDLRRTTFYRLIDNFPTKSHENMNIWRYFNSEKLTLSSNYNISFILDSVLRVNIYDCITLGAKNGDFVKISFTYGIRFCKIVCDFSLDSLTIRLPNRFKRLFVSCDEIIVEKIECGLIKHINLTSLCRIDSVEHDMITRRLKRNSIVDLRNHVLTVETNDNNTYYLQWNTLSFEGNFQYFIINSTSSLLISNSLQSNFKIGKFKRSVFIRTLDEMKDCNLFVAITGLCDLEREHYVVNEFNFTATNYYYLNLADIRESKMFNTIIEAGAYCQKFEKCLLILNFDLVYNESVSIYFEVNHLCKHFKEWGISIIFSTACVQKLSSMISIHLIKTLDVENARSDMDLFKRQFRFLLPQSVSLLERNELDLLNFRYNQNRLSEIPLGLRTGIASNNDVFEDFELELKNILKCSGSKIPNVRWGDVGGLKEVKFEIIKIVNLPLTFPNFFKRRKKSGIILYGPPGTGKTLCAKAIATECNLNFVSVKGPELLNMYIGESEANIRRLFSNAKQSAPCIVFFDELDSLAPKRESHGDSSGVMDRLVSQLLNEIDDISNVPGVIVIGATNRLDLIDPSLLRPGRLETLLYLGPTKEKEEIKNILKAQLGPYRCSVEISDFVNRIESPITGAELFGFTSRLLSYAIERMIRNNIDETITLIREDFENAFQYFQ